MTGKVTKEQDDEGAQDAARKRKAPAQGAQDEGVHGHEGAQGHDAHGQGDRRGSAPSKRAPARRATARRASTRRQSPAKFFTATEHAVLSGGSACPHRHRLAARHLGLYRLRRLLRRQGHRATQGERDGAWRVVAHYVAHSPPDIQERLPQWSIQYEDGSAVYSGRFTRGRRAEQAEATALVRDRWATSGPGFVARDVSPGLAALHDRYVFMASSDSDDSGYTDSSDHFDANGTWWKAWGRSSSGAETAQQGAGFEG